MESRILNISSARSTPHSAHFLGAGINGCYANLQRLANDKVLHSLQYTIPAVSNHYGNAFVQEEEKYETVTTTESTGSSLNVANTLDAKCYDEEEEADEDVEMSPAIEIISIDPNCDYDTEDEDDVHNLVTYKEVVIPCDAQNVITEERLILEQPVRISATVSEALGDEIDVNSVIESLEHDDIEPELQNLHGDSDDEEERESDTESNSDSSDNASSSGHSNSSSSSSSTSSSSSDTSDSESDDEKRKTNSNSSSSSCSSRSSSSASSHPSDYVNRSDTESNNVEDKNTLIKIIERRKLMAIDRRKRTNSVNRKSFSLPQSPVACSGNSLIHDVISLSFENLDMSAIANDISPLKAPVRPSESEDKLIKELAENNFDLASYITEDDLVATDSTASSYSASVQQKKEQHKPNKISPVKKFPKSRGKQLKMLRALMISPEHDVGGSTRRSCTSKARRIVENTDSESEHSEAEIENKECVKIFGIERSVGKCKRKDDIKADPTWNPTITNNKSTLRNGHSQKNLSTSSSVAASSHNNEASDSKPTVTTSKPNDNVNKTSNNKNKLLTAGSQLARNKMLSLMAKTKTLQIPKQTPTSASTTKSVTKTDDNLKVRKLPTSNVKLDHDYCSPKKGNNVNTTHNKSQRKAIEIPFLLPTVEQLRQKKNLIKNKKRLESKRKHVKNHEPCDLNNQKTEISKTIDESTEKHKTSESSPKQNINGMSIKSQAEQHAVNKSQPTQPTIAVQQKQVSLLKINQNKPIEVQKCIKSTASNEKAMVEVPALKANCSGNNDSVTRVKKKLNLQEYKKRRELPMDSSLCLESPSYNDFCIRNNSTVLLRRSESIEESIKCEDTDQCIQPNDNYNENNKSECKPILDPISAAKHKALRMQQLKKEAAIKSTEAKIIPKTVMPIVPLAEITSIKFDEQGNPLPYNKHDDKDHVKLHDDYEEIVIVSVGCNTEVTINPRETNKETVKIKDSSTTVQQEKDIPKNELLSDITDTIKRCQSKASHIISSNSLISSIHEVVIKKKTFNKTEGIDTIPSINNKIRLVGGGQANQQSSPNIGVSPPNAFSPGKPEKAGGIYDQMSALSNDETDTQRINSSQTKLLQHGEDKIIMHLRKDRERLRGVTVEIQTLPLDRFPELKRLQPVMKKERALSRSSCGSMNTRSSRQDTDRYRDRSRRQYRKRASRSSSSEHNSSRRISSVYRNSSSKRTSSRRSRSRCSSRRRTRSRSRSYRRHSRSSSRRRRSSVSSERKHYRERRYTRRNHRSRRSRRSFSTSSSSSSSSRSSYSRSRSRTSRTDSSSSSRPKSRARNDSRSSYRKQNISPERKIVYVGRLEPTVKREDLKGIFLRFGRVKQVTLHYKESGAKYGFVTFEKPQDAYKAIDASSSDPNLCNYDVSFGGRRAFCRTEYADLDGNMSQDQEPVPYIAHDGTLVIHPSPHATLPRKDEEESFEDMLMKLKKDISAKKPRKS